MKTFMQDITELLNDMKKLNIIKKWALCGGVAAKYYVNPPITKDIDFFVIIDDTSIMFMSPIYGYMISRGAKFKGHLFTYKGVTVDIIAAKDGLIMEGINKAVKCSIDNASVNILRANYLAAIALEVGRDKDIDRVIRLIDANLLDSGFYGLLDKYKITTKRLDYIMSQRKGY